MIKNIIFDLGAVLLDINVENFRGTLTELAKRFQVDVQQMNSDIFDDYERGSVSSDEFFEGVKSYLSSDLEVQQLKDAWASILLKPIEESMGFLHWAAKEYRVFLLSNTNEAHRIQFDGIFDKELGEGVFYELFERVYYSYEMKVIKPDLQIYKRVLEQNELIPEECLFIDDRQENAEGAELAGVNGWVFEGVKDWGAIKTYLHAKTT